MVKWWREASPSVMRGRKCLSQDFRVFPTRNDPFDGLNVVSPYLNIKSGQALLLLSECTDLDGWCLAKKGLAKHENTPEKGSTHPPKLICTGPKMYSMREPLE
jgi:hypothetical protein